MNIDYRPSGVCSKQIHIKVEDGIVSSLEFVGGCDGNLHALSRLVEGMPVEQIIAKLEGIRCGFKKTSCPDQLAKALKKAVPEA